MASELVNLNPPPPLNNYLASFRPAGLPVGLILRSPRLFELLIKPHTQNLPTPNEHPEDIFLKISCSDTS